MTNNNNNNNKEEEAERIDYATIQTDILLFMKDKIPYASPEEVLTLMGSILTSMLCETADMIQEKKNKYVNKEALAITLLEVITLSVKHTIKSNYEMEKLV